MIKMTHLHACLKGVTGALLLSITLSAGAYAAGASAADRPECKGSPRRQISTADGASAENGNASPKGQKAASFSLLRLVSYLDTEHNSENSLEEFAFLKASIEELGGAQKQKPIQTLQDYAGNKIQSAGWLAVDRAKILLKALVPPLQTTE